ncbi:MAG: hypothetical protein JST92_17235, partial [Deltaproteobacteria bacterium]|nr:hypothetical protein [Deltaproteobacteria bacterium]
KLLSFKLLPFQLLPSAFLEDKPRLALPGRVHPTPAPPVLPLPPAKVAGE